MIEESKRVRESYNSKNPPASCEEAKRRIDERETDIQKIKTQIEFAEPEGYPSEEEFRAWRRRAVGAVGHSRAEIKFLSDWIAKQSQDKQPTPAQNADPVVNVALTEANTWIETTIREISAQYTPLYGKERLPPNTPDAVKRRAELSEILSPFTEILRQATSLAQGCGMKKKERAAFRKPLLDLYDLIREECVVINTYLRQHGAELHAEKDGWTTFLLSLVERAVSDGFVISEEERTLVVKIRTKLLSRAASPSPK